MRREPGNDLILGCGGNRLPIRMTRQQRGRHLYVVGATGSGKTKFIEYLIQQDIQAWAKSQCGMIVVDPHGTLFDSIMSWVAARGLLRLPIVPIDLRRGDWAVSYNVLRPRPSADPAVVVGNLATAIAHSWGQGDMNATPRLAKWLRTILATVYEHGATLADALQLLSNPEVRRAMTARLRDRFASAIWGSAQGLRPGEFLDQVESTVNRLAKFLANQMLRATLCQTGPSFDFSVALEKGSIVLVSLATAGAQVDVEDARTVGSMLLSDLWTAAQIRGKAEEGAQAVKPFYVYVDEFQQYVNPTIADSLDQARGFGLHFTLAHQYPTQLRNRGELGEMIYNSVMANARSKVVFQLDHPRDLPELSLWLGRGAINLHAVKHQHYSTKVMGHRLSYMPSYSEGTSETKGCGSSESVGEGTSQTEGGGSSHTDTNSYASGGATTKCQGESIGSATNEGEGASSSLSWEEPIRLFGPSNTPPIRGTYNVGRGESTNKGSSDSRTESFSTAETEAWSSTTSEADTTSESWSTSQSRTRTNTTSKSLTKGKSTGTTLSPILMPIMGKEASPPQFWSLDEQMFMLTQRIGALPPCHALIRLAGENAPQSMTSYWLKPPLITARGRLAAHIAYLKRLAFALPMNEALQRLIEREDHWVRRARNVEQSLEPSSYARPVEARMLPAQTAAVDNAGVKKNGV